MPFVLCQGCGERFKIPTSDQKYLLTPEHFHCSATCLLESIKRSRANGKPGFLPVPKGFEDEDREHYSKEFDMFFRSAYEIEVAKWLTLNDLPWEYETVYFDVVGKVYIPDFRLLSYSAILEVKGLWLAGSKKKLRNVVNLYPRENIYVIDWTLRGSIRAETRDCQIVNGKVVSNEHR